MTIEDLKEENAQLRAAILDIIKRWSTERGMDGAISRARKLLMEHALRHPESEDVRRLIGRF